jgi:peptidoglycan hydrolase CwlO-like protein
MTNLTLNAIHFKYFQVTTDPSTTAGQETMPSQEVVTDNTSEVTPDNNNTGLPPVSRELEMLNEEIKQLMQEKIKLEGEVNQEEASMKLRESEIKSISNETETLIQMTKQLEAQKVCFIPLEYLSLKSKPFLSPYPI